MQNMGEHMRVVCRATQGLTEKPPTIHWTIGSTRIIPTDNIKVSHAQLLLLFERINVQNVTN